MEKLEKKESGCQYKDESNSICAYLAEIVNVSNAKMFKELKEQSTKISEHHSTEIILLNNLTTELALVKKNQETAHNDIEMLKEITSPKRYVRRIALAVIIAVILSVSISLTLFILYHTRYLQ